MTIPAFPTRRLTRLLGLALLTLNACAFAADTPAPASVTLMASVKTIIGDAECDHPDQCKVVPVGAKACGGPSGFLAWSVKTTDQPALLDAVNAQAEAEKAENKASGLVSDCRMMLAPVATCRPRASDGKKTCQFGQGGVRGLD